MILAVQICCHDLHTLEFMGTPLATQDYATCTLSAAGFDPALYAITDKAGRSYGKLSGLRGLDWERVRLPARAGAPADLSPGVNIEMIEDIDDETGWIGLQAHRAAHWGLNGRPLAIRIERRQPI